MAITIPSTGLPDTTIRVPPPADAAGTGAWTTYGAGSLSLLDLTPAVVGSVTGDDITLVSGRGNTGNNGALLYGPELGADAYDPETQDLQLHLLWEGEDPAPTVTAGDLFMGVGLANGGANLGNIDQGQVWGVYLDTNGSVRGLMRWEFGRARVTLGNIGGTSVKAVSALISPVGAGGSNALARFILTPAPTDTIDPIGENVFTWTPNSWHICLYIGLSGTLANAARFTNLRVSWRAIDRAPSP